MNQPALIKEIQTKSQDWIEEWNANEYYSKLTQFIRKNGVISLAGAFTVGFLIASLLKRRG